MFTPRLPGDDRRDGRKIGLERRSVQTDHAFDHQSVELVGRSVEDRLEAHFAVVESSFGHDADDAPAMTLAIPGRYVSIAIPFARTSRLRVGASTPSPCACRTLL